MILQGGPHHDDGVLHHVVEGVLGLVVHSDLVEVLHMDLFEVDHSLLVDLQCQKEECTQWFRYGIFQQN